MLIENHRILTAEETTFQFAALFRDVYADAEPSNPVIFVFDLHESITLLSSGILTAV